MASTTELVTDSMPDITAQEKPKTFKTMTMKERAKYVREVITVEPLVAFYLVAGLLADPALRALELEKACRSDAGYDDLTCESIVNGNLDNYTKENRVVEGLVTDMHSWNQPVQSLVPMILILFLGSYSDRHRLRKPFLLMPIFGEFFAVAGCILSIIFMKEWPLVVLGVMQTVVPSFFGAQAIFLMAVFAYIADVSTLEMRTLRIGIVQIVFTLCGSVVQTASGPFFDAIGYIGVLVTVGVIYLLGFLYGIFCIKESRKAVAIEDKKSFLADAFDPRHVIETFSLLFKTKPGNNRLHMVIVMVVLCIISACNIGEIYVIFYYLHTMFHWPAGTYALYSGINSTIHLIGTAVGVALFTKVLKLSDHMIILASFTDKIVSLLIMTFATSEMIFYIATIVSVITGISPIGIRSIATKVVSVDDLGKAQSLFGICETIGYAIGSPAYNRLYNKTIEIFPGAVFLFSIILTGICSLLILWLHILQKKPNTKINGEEKKEKDELDNGTQIENLQTTHI